MIHTYLTDKGRFKLVSQTAFDSVFLKERATNNIIPKVLESEVKVVDDLYIYAVDLNCNTMRDNQLYDIYVNGSNISCEGSVLNKPINIKETNYRFFIYRNARKNLSLKIEMVNCAVKASLRNHEKDLCLILQNVDFDYESVDLIMKMRSRQDLYVHYNEYVLASNINIIKPIHSSEMQFPKNVQHNATWDVFLRFVSGETKSELPIILDKEQDDILHSDYLYDWKIKVDGNNLQFTTNRNETKVISQIKTTCSEEQLNLMIETKNRYTIESCYIKARHNNGLAYSNLEPVKKVFDKEESTFTLKINEIKPTLQLVIWDYYITVYDSDSQTHFELMLECDQLNKEKFKAETFEIENYITKFKTLALRVEKDKFFTKVKIAVSGSCFSRSAFQTKEFFNPKYKENFEVVHTNFHSSIPSMMAKPKVFEETYLGECTDFQKRNIKNDFEKNFFENLLNSNSDFLIIDFYADAVRPLIYFEDGVMITDSYTLRGTDYIYHLGNSKIITHYDENYLAIWKKSFDKFADKLEKLYDPNRVILQRARTALKYIDKSGKVNSFNKEEVLDSRVSNNLFEYMEMVFLERFPNASVLDLTKKGYLGYEDHPEGKSVSHYQSEYYRDFLIELEKIILQKISLN
ncbi:hypothetical protein BAQ47_05620 [Bacillus tropicus]|uniref:DUF6270 domain-containing protein n=1 Tax=Bacillus tropicus TaxID=2026188 RepID=UPI0008FDA19C|nr:DUF6270 domain-containing protein [Bacillus tropicus]OJE32128.1 hypothetical protein BAQ47_05620 [Bacillus tropicus]